MIWLPKRRAVWIWAALLPLAWIVPAVVGFSLIFGGDPDLFAACGWALLLLPLFAGAPSGWVLRPLGVLGWLWIPFNVGCGLLAAAFIGLIALGA